MVQIIGSYKLERHNEYLEEFYKDIGLTMIQRKILRDSYPTIQISKDEEEQWNLKTVFNVLKKMENSFKLDEEYDDKMPNGIPLKSITTMDGDSKLVTQSKLPEERSGFTIKTNYEFNEDGMIMTLQTSIQPDMVAKCYYKRLPSPEKSD